MLTDTLKKLYRRDLEKAIIETNLYRDENHIWQGEKDIANSAGNLILHLVGNLNTYIGAVIGKTGYIRNRELEFSLKNIPRAELVKNLQDTIGVVETSLDKMPPEQLNEEYPVLVFDKKTSTEYLLVHLATHLTYHLGQINYHRRLLDK